MHLNLYFNYRNKLARSPRYLLFCRVECSASSCAGKRKKKYSLSRSFIVTLARRPAAPQALKTSAEDYQKKDPLWTQFFLNAIVQEELFRIFVERFNLLHSNYYIFIYLSPILSHGIMTAFPLIPRVQTFWPAVNSNGFASEFCQPHEGC